MDKQWRCIVCGYIHTGANPPEVCPVCGVTSENFESHEEIRVNNTASSNEHVVIIGAGIAGVTAAEEIRKHAADIKITLISSEEVLPYYRLNLTRYLAGEVTRQELEIHEAKWYTKERITLITGQEVSDINRAAKKLYLASGEELSYDKLIMAMGAQPFIPPFNGNPDNAVAIRTISDADKILQQLSKAKNCICIGGGILGLETAGAIAKNKIKTEVLEMGPWLMPRQLNHSAGEILRQSIEAMGISVRGNVKVKAILGEKVSEGVSLETGEELMAPIVIVAAGVRPNTALAKKIGLTVNQGLIVDNYLKTSDESIYGAGDITEHDGIVYGLWNAAQQQGKVAALNVLGIKTEFSKIPRSNIMKVLDIDLFSIGDITDTEGISQIEKTGSNQYYMFMLKADKLTASIIIGDKEAVGKVQQAIEQEAALPLSAVKTADDILALLI